jgi:hypothetical protein
VDAIEVALTAPLFDFVPWTVIVSPGFSSESTVDALREIFVDDATTTLTRPPLEVVTKMVLPSITVTVPVAAEAVPGPAIPVVPDPVRPVPRAKGDVPVRPPVALDEEVPWLR